MPTNEQRKKFQQYIWDYDRTKLSDVDAQEFLDTWTIWSIEKFREVKQEDIKPIDTPKEEIKPVIKEEPKKDIKATPWTPPQKTKIVDKVDKADTTDTPDTTEFNINEVISKAPVFKWADGKQYQTVRNKDNTLTTIDISTGQPVTWKYTDDKRDAIKQSFLDWVDTSQETVIDRNSIYQGILDWQVFDLKTKNSVEYKEAYKRKLDLDKYSNMSANDLAYSISSNDLLPWTQTYTDLKQKDPQLISDAEKLNAINALNSDKKINVDDVKTKILSEILDTIRNQDKETVRDKLSNNENINKLNEVLWESATKLAEYKDQLEFAKEDIEKDLWWKSVTKWYKNFLIWERNRELTRAYNLELMKYNTTAGQIKTISDDIKYEYETAQAQDQQKLENLATELGIYDKMTEEEKINTVIVTDEATGRQALVNSQTGEIIKTFDTGLKSGITTPKIQNIWTSDKPNYVTYNQSTGQWESISVKWASTDSFWKIDYSTVDWSTNTDLINQYVWEASFKNNNPTWMTWGISNNLKWLFDEAWINYSKWSFRPANEWWNYIKFWSVQDWLDAYMIALTEAWSDNVFNRLATWVWTTDTENNNRYATEIMNNAWIEKWAKFSELSDNQLWSLMNAQLQKESPNFYNELSNIETKEEDVVFTNEAIVDYEKYLKWKLWAAERKIIATEYWGMDNFKKQAEAYNNSENGPRQQELEKITWLRDTVSDLLENKTAIEDLTGLIKTATPWQIENKNAFIWDIQNLLDKNTLQTLIDVKADWATFWALSNEELRMLQKAANKVSSLALFDDEDNPTVITWFKWWKKNFEVKMKEMLNRYNEVIQKKERLMWTTWTTSWTTWWRIKWKTTWWRIK